MTGRCDACHDNRTATGKPGDHFGTTLDCDRCHDTRSWDNPRYSHPASSGYPGDHRARLDCTDCHRNNQAANPWTFPGLAPDCGGCHRNDFQAGEHKKIDNPRTNYTASELSDCTGACHVYKDATLSQISDRKTRHHRVSDGSFD